MSTESTASKGSILTIAVLLAGTILATLNQTALNPALPIIMTDMQVDAVTVQWLVSAYSLVNAMVIPLSAYLMGRFTTRKLFIGGLTLFTAGSVLACVAPAFPVILIGRMLQAVCAGINTPLMLSVMLLAFPREKRGSAMGVVTLALCFAPAVGPTISGLIVGFAGWRALFAVVSAAAVCVWVLAFALLRNYGDFEPAGFDKPSVALCALGLASLIYGISTVSSSPSIALTAALIVVGIALLALFTRRQLKLANPLLNIGVLKVRDFRVMAVVSMLLMGTLISLNVIMPLYIQNTRGYPALATGLAMLPGALIGGAASVLAGRLFDRAGVRRCAVPGILVVLLGAFLLTLLGPFTDIVVIALVYSVLPIGLQFTQTPMNTWGLNSLDNRVLQHGNALVNTLNQVSASLMTAVLVTATAIGGASVPQESPLMQGFTGQHWAFLVLLGVAAVAALVVLLLVRQPKKAKNRQGSQGTLAVTGVRATVRATS